MNTRHLLPAIALLALPLAVSCTSPGNGWTPTPSTSVTTVDEIATEPAVETSDENDTSYEDIGADDFLITLTTTRRQCFGSDGCNVTVEPDLTYIGLGEIDPSATYEITYEITGDEDGPVVDTATLSDETNLRYTPSALSTATTDEVEFTVTVIDVRQSL